MASESMVIEDGRDDTRVRSRQRPSWSLITIGFVFGLALGLLAAAPLDTSVGGEPAEEPVRDEAIEQSLSPLESGIADFVSGFPDSMIVVGDGADGGLEHMLWPVRGPLITRSMNRGDEVHVDVSGKFFAVSQSMPGVDGVLLSVGRFTDVEPVETGVTSFAWHDAEPGKLAYTTESNGLWRMDEISALNAPGEVRTPALDGGAVAAWGDWGYAVQGQDGTVMLLTPEGEYRASEQGEALASHRSGWVLLLDQGLKLVSAGGGVRRLEETSSLEEVFAAEFSPDGRRIAVSAPTGLVVYDRGGDVITEAPNYPAAWVSWSSDSRFLISPARSGVFVTDLVEGGSQNLLFGYDVVVAGVNPLTSS